LPKEADLVFDARFLRNPHYDPMLRPRTGLDPAVGEYIRADQDYAAYLSGITELVDLVLPRFVHEGKKYATIAIGCTGGRHRSVYLIERLAAHLSSRLAATHAAGESGLDWRQTVTHRELKPGETSPDGYREAGRAGDGHSDGGHSEGDRGLSEDLFSGARDAAPDLARTDRALSDGSRGDVQADGDGQKTTPIQAQEA